MNDYINSAQADIQILDELIQKIQVRLERAPDGSLAIMQKDGRAEFYLRLPGSKGKLIYINKNDMALARALAQKDYDRKILKHLKAERAALLRLEASFPAADIDSVYEDLGRERRNLVEPVRLTDELYVKKWLEKPYAALSFREDDKSSYYSGAGERVRSKSEVIIADLLRRMDIPYKYECPLSIGERIFYPDFTILDVRRRSTIYLEHFGMMDDPDYSINFTRKLAVYESARIYPGEKLIMTFESSAMPLDTRRLEKTIRHYLG